MYTIEPEKGIEDNKEKERESLERELDMHPNNFMALIDLIEILGEESSTNERILRLDINNVGVYARLINSIKYENNQKSIDLLVRRLELEPSNKKIRNSLRKIAKSQEDKNRKKELLEKIFEIYPDDIKVMKHLATIAKEEGDTEKEKKFLERILKLQSKKETAIFAMLGLLDIAKAEGDIEREEELIAAILQIKPYSKKAIFRSITLARMEQRTARENQSWDDLRSAIQREKELLERLLQLEPNNVAIIRSLRIVAIKEGDKKRSKELKAKLEKLSPYSVEQDDSKALDENSKMIIKAKMLNRMQKSEETPISEARKLIYESQDIMADAEEIKKLLEGENETDRTLVLAELYYHTGLIDRSNKLLNAYKRTLDSNASLEEIKAVNQAIQITQTKRQVGFEWNEFWDRREASKLSENNDVSLEEQTQTSTDSEER